MEASGDKAMGSGGDGGATVSAGTWGASVGDEHDANRKLSTKAGRKRMDFSDWFITGNYGQTSVIVRIKLTA